MAMDCCEQQYSLLSRWSELESFQVCKMEGLCVLPSSPLKGGVLSGKVKRNIKPTEGRIAWVAEEEKTRKHQAGPGWSSLDDTTFDIETAEKIGQAIGKSTAQVAMRWLLQKDVVSSVIIGATKISQHEDNMGAATGWSLSAEEMEQAGRSFQERFALSIRNGLQT